MSKIDTALTITLVACAVATVSILIKREVLRPTMPDPASAQKDVFIDDWRSLVSSGVQLGSSGAPVQIIEFADFECPFCASFYKTIQALRRKYPTQVGVTLIQFPLPMHRFAIPAARAAECANEQGHFEDMHGQLFAQQEQFGLKSWVEMARDAGVTDLVAFESCTKRTELVSAVEKGKALGEKLNIQGTPTVIMNGWKLGRPPSGEELDRMVQRVLEHKPVNDN